MTNHKFQINSKFQISNSKQRRRYNMLMRDCDVLRGHMRKGREIPNLSAVTLRVVLTNPKPERHYLARCPYK